MKPKRIILVRHGESEGNADKRRLEVIPDYAHELTTKGVGQAKAAGEKINGIIGRETVHAYISPWHRTRKNASPMGSFISGFPMESPPPTYTTG